MGEKGLRALLGAATPGPWCTDEVDEDQISVFGTIFAADKWSEDAPWLYDPRDATAEDSRLVVAAVNALPALLDVAAAARGLVEIERPLLDADDVPHPSPLNRAVTALEAALGGLQDAG